MQRYFVKNTAFQGAHVFIEGQDAFHIRQVMRQSVGEHLLVVNENKELFNVLIVAMDKARISGRIIEKIDAMDTTLNLTIAPALIRKERFEWMLEKATELGVKAILPVKMKRCIVKIDDQTELKKINRYQSIVKEASEQSERLQMPVIHPLSSFNAIDFSSYDLVIACYERAPVSVSLQNLITSIPKQAHVLIFIGPEGGFDETELAYLIENQIPLVSLGSSILRTETAVLYVLAAFRYQWAL